MAYNKPSQETLEQHNSNTAKGDASSIAQSDCIGGAESKTVKNGHQLQRVEHLELDNTRLGVDNARLQRDNAFLLRLVKQLNEKVAFLERQEKFNRQSSKKSIEFMNNNIQHNTDKAELYAVRLRKELTVIENRLVERNRLFSDEQRAKDQLKMQLRRTEYEIGEKTKRIEALEAQLEKNLELAEAPKLIEENKVLRDSIEAALQLRLALYAEAIDGFTEKADQRNAKKKVQNGEFFLEVTVILFLILFAVLFFKLWY